MGEMAHYPTAALSGGGETCAVPAASQQLLRLKVRDEVTLFERVVGPSLGASMELVGYVAGPRFAWAREIKGLAGWPVPVPVQLPIRKRKGCQRSLVSEVPPVAIGIHLTFWSLRRFDPLQKSDRARILRPRSVSVKR